MARVETDPNYTTPTFSRATAPTDPFKKEDIQLLAAAFSTHVHDGVGKGLLPAAHGANTVPGSAIVDGSITGAKIADGTITAAVNEINAGRREVYTQTATKSGVSPDAAGQATGAQLIAKVPAGQFFKPLGGAWTKR